MLSIINPLPYEIRQEGHIYKLTPAFDNVLRMYKEIEGLDEWDKLDVMLFYLLKNPPKKPTVELLKKVSEVIFKPANGESSGGDKSFDFEQDSDLIYAAFMQAYGIDLFKEQGKLHWWKFSALLNSLPSNTRFSEIVSIRTRPIPAPTKYNEKERADLIRLKRIYSLELSAAEKREKLQKSLQGLVTYLDAATKGK